MNPPTPLYQTIAGAVLLLAVIGVVGALSWHGVLTGNDAYGLLTAIVGLGGGALAVHAGVSAGAKAANTTPSPAPTTAEDDST